MFESLSEKLDLAFKNLKGEGRLTELNIANSIKEIRRALVAADVNYKIAKEFTDKIKDKALGTENVLTSIKPGELMVKIVQDEMTELMGGQSAGINIKGNPGVILISGLPGTIDNDIFGTDYTIGFDTAINTAVEAVDKIRDTADSHNRLFFVEVMGRHAGFIALHTGIGSGAGAIFLPELDSSIEELSETLRRSVKRQKLFNLVIVAEGNKNGDANEIASQIKERNPEFDVKVTIIGHLQRGGSPTAMDRVLASRMGHSAVKALMRGEGGVALGIINDKITFTPFKDAIGKTKSLNKDLVRMAEILAL